MLLTCLISLAAGALIGGAIVGLAVVLHPVVEMLLNDDE